MEPPVRIYRQKPNDFFAAVEVSACYCEYQGTYLWLHRAENRSQGGTWGVPAGKLEVGETPLDGVVREVWEETGIALAKDSVHSLGPLFVRTPSIDFVYHMFYCVFLEEPKVHLSEEHTAHLWIKPEEIKTLPLILGAFEAMEHFFVCVHKIFLPRREFYFVRHGETDATFTSYAEWVDLDLPLNEKGKNQADSCIKTMPPSLQTVCFSPMKRAKETKQRITQPFSLKEVEIEELYECGGSPRQGMVAIEEGFPISEEAKEFLLRVQQGLIKALKQEGPVLICAHGGTHWALCYFFAIAEHSWRAKHCRLLHFSPQTQGTWSVAIL